MAGGISCALLILAGSGLIGESASLQEPQAVTLEVWGEAAGAALAKISAQVGERWSCTDGLQDKPLILVLKGAPADEVRARIAWCLRGRWQREPGGWRLGPDAAARRAEAEAKAAEREKAFQQHWRIGWTEETDSAWSSLSGSLAALLSPQDIARISREGRVVFSTRPTARQAPMNAAMRQRAAELIPAALRELRDPKGPRPDLARNAGTMAEGLVDAWLIVQSESTSEYEGPEVSAALIGAGGTALMADPIGAPSIIAESRAPGGGPPDPAPIPFSPRQRLAAESLTGSAKKGGEAAALWADAEGPAPEALALQPILEALAGPGGSLAACLPVSAAALVFSAGIPATKGRALIEAASRFEREAGDSPIAALRAADLSLAESGYDRRGLAEWLKGWKPEAAWSPERLLDFAGLAADQASLDVLFRVLRSGSGVDRSWADSGNLSLIGRVWRQSRRLGRAGTLSFGQAEPSIRSEWERLLFRAGLPITPVEQRESFTFRPEVGMEPSRVLGRLSVASEPSFAYGQGIPDRAELAIGSSQEMFALFRAEARKPGMGMMYFPQTLAQYAEMRVEEEAAEAQGRVSPFDRERRKNFDISVAVSRMHRIELSLRFGGGESRVVAFLPSEGGGLVLSDDRAYRGPYRSEVEAALAAERRRLIGPGLP